MVLLTCRGKEEGREGRKGGREGREGRKKGGREGRGHNEGKSKSTPIT